MSRVDEALGALPATRAPDAHHGARDALTPLGLAKWRAYFRAQPPLAEGIDCATEIPGVSAGYELRTGRANELEPLLRQALPIAKMNLEAPDRATLTRAFGGLGKGAPFALSEEDKGAVAPAIVALKALRATEAKRAEGGDEASAREKKKRKRESKKEKKDKRKRTDDGGQTTSQGVSAGISTGDSDGTRNTGARRRRRRRRRAAATRLRSRWSSETPTSQSARSSRHRAVVSAKSRALTSHSEIASNSEIKVIFLSFSNGERRQHRLFLVKSSFLAHGS